MSTLVLDSQGRPVPQILDRESGDMAPWQGANGAGDMNLKEYTAQASGVVTIPAKALPVAVMIPDATGGYLLQSSKTFGLTVDVARVQGSIKIDSASPVSVTAVIPNGIEINSATPVSVTTGASKGSSTPLASASRSTTTTSAAIANTKAKNITLILGTTAGSGVISKIELLATIDSVDYVIGQIVVSLSGVGATSINIGPDVIQGIANKPYGIACVIPSAYKYRITQDSVALTYYVHEIWS